MFRCSFKMTYLSIRNKLTYTALWKKQNKNKNKNKNKKKKKNNIGESARVKSPFESCLALQRLKQSVLIIFFDNTFKRYRHKS